MFIIEFDDSATILRKVVDIVKDRIPEGTMIVKPEGIFFQSLDVSHVALVDLSIRPEAASSYDCDDEVHPLGIRMVTLAKIFSCSSSKGVCRMSYDEHDAADVLKIEFSSGGKVASYELKLLDATFEEMIIPAESIPTCQQVLSASNLQSKLKDLANFTEDVSITRQNDELVFKGDGELANVAFTMEVPGPLMEDAVTSMFALPYLQWFAKSASLNDDVLLAFNNELPMLLQFSEPDLYTLRFFLSPKITDA